VYRTIRYSPLFLLSLKMEKYLNGPSLMMIFQKLQFVRVNP
jgi:hypothetical protein